MRTVPGARARLGIRTVLLVLVVLAGVAVAAPLARDARARPGPVPAELAGARAWSADAEALVAGVVHASPGDLGPARLRAGMVPPTNRWFSGLVFGKDPQPVFPVPLSFALSADGFTLGLPVPQTGPAAIVGPHVPALRIGLGAASARVSAYDAASVTLELLDDGGDVRATVVLAEGSPFVSVTASAATTVTTSAAFATGTVHGSTAVATATIAGREWGLASPAGSQRPGSLGLDAGATASFYAVPDDVTPAGRAALAEAAADRVVGVRLAYAVDASSVRTTLRYDTANGTPTLIAVMPHLRERTAPGGPDCALGTYPSVYGRVTLCPGPALVTESPRLTASGGLDLTRLDAATRAHLVTQLRADVAATGAFPADTYFGAKALYRSAMLVSLGRGLGADLVVAPLATRLEAALREWADPHGCATRRERCVVYDEKARGVVGLEPSFGSELFNDHHFHYGYLLSAAGILAADDPALARELAPVMDLLALDIAAGTSSTWFPQLRVFDAYRGHSWASGTSPFADGNNQESSSEAVSAWNGLALWASASGQAELETEATWLLSTEAATARALWTEPDLTDAALDGYGHQVVALSWGAKRDYATWFSAEPNAMFGIQLIPMPPVDGALAGDPAHVRAAIAEATPKGYGVQFGDYLVMYLALVDPGAARALVQGVPDTAIDDADSRTYLEAWVAAPPAGAS